MIATASRAPLVLLVEDNPGDRRLAREGLAGTGEARELVEVEDGREALAYLRGQDGWSGARTPDLILLDLHLPALDGLEVVRSVKSDPRLSTIPVVVLSSSAAPGDVHACYAAGANCYLQKPVDLDESLRLLGLVDAFWLRSALLPGERRAGATSLGREPRGSRAAPPAAPTGTGPCADGAALRTRTPPAGQEALRVLMIEDNPGDARLVLELLSERPGARIDVEHAARLADGLERLEREDYDAVLLDLSLPGESQGLDTLRAVQRASPTVPVLVFSGILDEHLAVEAVHEGAQDYLVKGDLHPRLLVRSILYAIERQRMTDEMERTRRGQLELKDRFLSHVSHELRSPLSAIHQFVTLLLDGLVGELTDEQKDILDAVFRNTGRLTGMIDDLLDVTRAQTGKLKVEPVRMDPGAAVDEVARTYRSMLRSRGLEVVSDLAPGLPPVHGDPARVQQILTNFLDNAARHTPEGGRITVRTCTDPDRPDHVRVEVEDTGCGIEASEQDRIFERLYQTGDGHQDAREGLGLGLYICKLLVARQGGRIGLRSTPGQGSTFWFTLPAQTGRRNDEPLAKGTHDGA